MMSLSTDAGIYIIFGFRYVSRSAKCKMKFTQLHANTYSPAVCRTKDMGFVLQFRKNVPGCGTLAITHLTKRRFFLL